MGKRAAFYDLDGTLANSNIVYAYVYFALVLPKIRERLFRLGRLALLSPSYAIAEQIGRKFFNRYFYNNYKGISYQMLKLMGRRIANKALLPHIFNDARQRIEKGASMGLLQVIVSGSLDLLIEPLSKELGIDHYIANRLEYAGDRATGRLCEPILSDKAKAEAVCAFAEKHEIDLGASYAFGDSIADLPMLESVAFPCAVNPQRKLKKIALERNWPVLAFA